MNIIDYVAILGALAWMPHLITMLKSYFSKSKIRVITEKCAEIGFTTYGPIFNLRLAFSVDFKDIVISDLKVRLKHESGEERVFEWQGITQQVGKMTVPDAGTMPFEKEHSVLAIKLNQKNIEERFIKFQDPSFISSKSDFENLAIKKMEYLKSEDRYVTLDFLREPEMTELYAFNKQAFPWKQGEYTFTVELKSPEVFETLDNSRRFTITPMDIERLTQNKEQLEAEYKRNLVGIEEGAEEVIWHWVKPVLQKT